MKDLPENPILFDEFLERWSGNSSTKIQISLLTRIADALRQSPDCSAAVVVGSFAKGNADRLSDIDLVVFCAEGTGRSLSDTIRQQIAPLSVLIALDGDHDSSSPFQKLIFDDFTSVEFHVMSPLTDLILEQPYVEIVNRNRCLQSRASPTLAPTKRDMTVFRYGERFLAWELLNCLKWLWRGDLKTAKRYLVMLGRAIEASEESDGSGPL